MPRLFVAIDLPLALKEELQHQQNGLQNARWLGVDQLHLTLHFIGEVDDTRLPVIDEALRAVQTAAFEIQLAGMATFPPQGKVQVVLVKVQPAPLLTRLHEQVGQALQTTGYQPETRAYIPHVTLARFRESPPPAALHHYLQQHQTYASVPFAVERFILYRSTLQPTGAEYSHEQIYSLVVKKS